MYNDVIKRGDIFKIDLGKGDGSVQGGLRYCVVVSNNAGNIHAPTVIVVPITSQQKTSIPTHVEFHLFKPSIILCEQIFTVSKERLVEHVRFAGKNTMQKVDEALAISLHY